MEKNANAVGNTDNNMDNNSDSNAGNDSDGNAENNSGNDLEHEADWNDEQGSVSVSNITVNPTNVNIPEGESVTVTATVIPSNATNKNITWKSSNTDVAFVMDGLIVARKSGTATITVTTDDGAKAANVFVTVTAKAIDGTGSNLAENVGNNSGENTGSNSSGDTGNYSGGNSENRLIPVTRVTFINENIALAEGESAQLSVNVEPENASDPRIKWTSTNPDTVEVLENGIVIAKTGAAGQVAVIYAEAQDGSGMMAACVVVVRSKEMDGRSGNNGAQLSVVPVTSVTVNPKEFELPVNENKQLTAVIEPENASDANITWVSSDENIVEVTKNGLVIAKKEGTAAVLLRTSNDEVATACVVTVVEKKAAAVDKKEQQSPLTGNSKASDSQMIVKGQEIKVDLIELSGISKKIAAGKEIRLTAEVYPTNATQKTLKWESSNTQYATVDQNGRVSVKKQGRNKTVEITAMATDGSHVKAVYNIEIMPNAVKKIKLKAAKSVKAGKKITIKAMVTPSKQVNKKLKWESNKTKYATVNSKGVVKTKKAGKGKTVKITARATDGSNKKNTIKIKIK